MGSEGRIRVVIVDDEHPARLILRELAAVHADGLEVVGEARNGREGSRLLNELRPDAVFLDINMPDMNGFELLAQARYQPLVIFTTAYEQHAIAAFGTNSVDYLV